MRCYSVFTSHSIRRTCNSGKASDWDAITWGAAIGGRTATVPKKQQRTERLRLRAMSALDQKQTSHHVRLVSVNPLKADIRQRGLHVRKVPCMDGSRLARVFFTCAALVGAAMCSAC